MLRLCCASLGRQTRAEWGEFGDAFGVVTSLFTALAFAGLIATVVLQSVELRETRKQLAEQAKAQPEYAEAARQHVIAQDLSTYVAVTTLFQHGGYDSDTARALMKHLGKKVKVELAENAE